MTEAVIDIKGLVTQFGSEVIHNGIDLQVYKGEILGIVGGSGSGKSVLLRTILGLNPLHSGSIKVFGLDCRRAKSIAALRTRWGVLFQSGALFSSMTVGENIKVPLREVAHLPESLMEELVPLKLAMVGLPPEAKNKLPAHLSGGMVKRASLARALAVDAELLFLDEPTAGLDPISASAFDDLIKKLRANLNLTVVMITHDLDSLYALCDRVAVLVDKQVLVGDLEEITQHPHPWIRAYFQGFRGRQVQRA